MDSLKTDFVEDRAGLFQLALKTGLLTVVTAGLYRFWQITRLRRWYWSAIRPGGTPLEYAGTAQEKLMGFLLAVIVLAFYIAAFNMIAIFVALGISQDLPDYVSAAALATPISLVPMIFMARYRARRYMLARTRWRGVRFGMTPGAWGYAWRACLYWTLSLCTLGLLWPLLTLRLEKYLTDRTWFGSARFTQFGGVGGLYRLLFPFLLCLWGSIALVVAAGITGQDSYALGLLITLPLTLFCAVYYRVASVRHLATLKTLGDGLEFEVFPRTGRIVSIWIWGSLLTGLVVALISPIVLGLVFGALSLVITVTPEMIMNPPPNIAAMLAVVTWIVVFVFYGVFRQVFVTYPTVRHIAETVIVHEPDGLGSIRQRDRDTRTDAGGFADALDVGAAF